MANAMLDFKNSFITEQTNYGHWNEHVRNLCRQIGMFMPAVRVSEIFEMRLG